MKRLLFGLLCCILLSQSCKQNSQSEINVSREVITATKTSISINETYSATIKGRQDVEIFPQVTGKIDKICITEGASIHKGQTLFIIDQVPYLAAKRVADANVKIAEAEVETAKLDMDSKSALFKENIVSDYDISLARNTLSKAEAQLEQAKAIQTNAANDLSYTVVKSPVNGVAGTLPYREGALVGPSMTAPLTVVSDNNEMFVYFSVSERKYREMINTYGSTEQIINQMPPIELQFSDGTQYSQNGRIESISGVMNTSTGTVSVRALFSNSDKTLLSGSVANVIIPFEYNDVIVIPQEAVFEIQGKFFVQKVIDGKASTVEVLIESVQDGRNYIVLQGLEDGDQIIGAGAGLVRDGDIIK